MNAHIVLLRDFYGPFVSFQLFFLPLLFFSFLFNPIPRKGSNGYRSVTLVISRLREHADGKH